MAEAEGKPGSEPRIEPTVGLALDQGAETVARALLGYGTEHAHDLPALELEKENMLAAMDWARVASRQDMMVSFARILVPLLVKNGDWFAARDAAEKAIDAIASTQANGTTHQAYLLLDRANLAERQGDHDEGVEFATQALTIFVRRKIPMGKARVDFVLGNINYRRARYEDARANYEEAEATFAKEGDARGIAAALHQKALTRADQRRYQDARGLYQRSLEFQGLPDAAASKAGTLHQLAIVDLLAGQTEKARAGVAEAESTFVSLGEVKGRAAALQSLGILGLIEGEFDRAQSYLEQSLNMKRRLGDKGGVANSYGQLGILSLLRERHDYAERFLNLSLQIKEFIGDDRGIANSHYHRALLELRRRNFTSARSRLEASLQVSKRLGDDTDAQEALLLMWGCATRSGDQNLASRLRRQLGSIISNGPNNTLVDELEDYSYPVHRNDFDQIRHYI